MPVLNSILYNLLILEFEFVAAAQHIHATIGCMEAMYPVPTSVVGKHYISFADAVACNTGAPVADILGPQFVQLYQQIKSNPIFTAAHKAKLKAAKQCAFFTKNGGFCRQDAIDGYVKAEEVLGVLFSASNSKGQKLLEDVRRKRRIAEKNCK
jgi:hypothetical protein